MLSSASSSSFEITTLGEVFGEAAPGVVVYVAVAVAVYTERMLVVAVVSSRWHRTYMLVRSLSPGTDLRLAHSDYMM